MCNVYTVLGKRCTFIVIKTITGKKQVLADTNRSKHINNHIFALFNRNFPPGINRFWLPGYTVYVTNNTNNYNSYKNNSPPGINSLILITRLYSMLQNSFIRLLLCFLANTSTKSSRFMALALLDSTISTPKLLKCSSVIVLLKAVLINSFLLDNLI